MKLPKLGKSERYVGLYVIDFGDHSGVGFTADEAAELLESEKYKDCKVYKIHKAYPDGRVELKGVSRETFELENGMFFYSTDKQTAEGDFKRLVNLAVRMAPPCRAKAHLAKFADGKYVTALIYPAEYDDEVSGWLSDGEYKTAGPAEGGISVVTGYYEAKPEILKRHQLFGKNIFESRTGLELLRNLKVAVQR